MKSINVPLTSEQLDNICHALLMYEIDSRDAGYKYMPDAIYEVRKYLNKYLDECFN